VRNNIRTDHTDKWWPYGTSPQRIGFLSNARNNALEPLQSANESVRLPDYDQFTKVVFFNDVVFSWQSVVRLIATSVDDKPGEEGYDLACGMDYSGAGECAAYAFRLDLIGCGVVGLFGGIRIPGGQAKVGNCQNTAPLANGRKISADGGSFRLVVIVDCG
jgi:hypothetical protein